MSRRGSQQSDAAWLRSRARTTRTSVQKRLAKLKRDDRLPSIDDFHAELTEQMNRPICRYCGVPLTRKNFGVDHDHPISRGGSAECSNLHICCKACNGAKGNLTGAEFFDLRELTSKWHDGGKSLFVRLRLGAFNVRRS